MLKEFELGGEAIDYIRSVLSKGATLGRALLQLPLEAGRVHVHLPEMVSEKALGKFESGGVLPPSGVKVQRLGYTMTYIDREEGDAYLAEFIGDYLRASVDHWAIFEDSWARPDDSWLAKDEVQSFTHEKEVYYFLRHEDYQTETIFKHKRAAITHVPIAVLTAGSEEIRTRDSLSTETLLQFANRSEHILVGAYDREADLIWSKR